MRFVVVPHCVKKLQGQIAESMSGEVAQKLAKKLGECVALAYPTFNLLELKSFGKCMAGE